MYFDGYLVIDHEGQPLKPFRCIPFTLSSKIEGWRAEAIRRSDPRIRNMDLIARMPVKVEPSANGIPSRKPVVKTNALAGRQNRFREQAGGITWAKATAKNVRDFLWSLLPQDCRDNNLALPRDLTRQEIWQLRALNVGKKPQKARKVPNADKGMTRDQYIDGVRKRAAGILVPRVSNARRLHKEATRRALREATAESLPEVSSISQDEPEQVHEVADLQTASLPASAALAAPAILNASTAPAAPSTPASLLSAVRAPLVLGPVNPPFPFVRPGEYLYDEQMVWFY